MGRTQDGGPVPGRRRPTVVGADPPVPWVPRLPPYPGRVPAPHPDYRFSLANERTLLAWLRTALALVAGGVAVGQFVPELGVPGGSLAVSVALMVGGLLTALAGYRRWSRAEAAIVADEPLPVSPLAGWVTGALAVLVVVVVVLVLLEAAR
ncbi:MAG: hypothetical protein JWQ53_3133 [Klenkia sp.]|nr:hypothetical protein [Klenkia sp.]